MTCRGHLLDKMGQHDAAIRDFSAIIDLSPSDVNAHFSRGFSYDKVGNIDGAVSDYMRALELDSK